MSPKFSTREEYESWKAERMAAIQRRASAPGPGDDVPESAAARTARAVAPEALLSVAPAPGPPPSPGAEAAAPASPPGAAPAPQEDVVPGVGLLQGIAALNLVASLIVAAALLAAAVNAERGDPAPVWAAIGITVLLEGLIFYGFVRVFVSLARDVRSARLALEARAAELPR